MGKTLTDALTDSEGRGEPMAGKAVGEDGSDAAALNTASRARVEDTNVALGNNELLALALLLA